MAKDNNTTLSHVYGIASLIPGLVGLVYLVKREAPWQEYALLGSGWLTALFYGVMLWRCFTQSRMDGESIGYLSERVNSLSRELDSRNALLDYLSGLLLGKTATPKASAQTIQSTQAKDE